MATLLEIVAYKVGNHIASRLIQAGFVRVNGVTDRTDHPLDRYDIIEFGDKRMCYLGYNYLVIDYPH